MQTNPNIFFTPASLGALPALWLQAKLTITLQPFQDKMSRLFLPLLLSAGCEDAPTLFNAPLTVLLRSLTIQLAEQLAQYISSLFMRHAAELATPHTQCLLYATYWFRPIVSELLGAATESVKSNRNRTPIVDLQTALAASCWGHGRKWRHGSSCLVSSQLG